jgi:hypothetical protein
MSYSIIPFSIEHLTAFRDVFDSVARERKYLAFVAAPPLEIVRTFVTRNMELGCPHFLAIADERVIGWCDSPCSE